MDVNASQLNEGESALWSNGDDEELGEKIELLDDHSNRSVSGSAEKDDAPQALVREETKAIGIIRIILAGLLIAIAVATSMLIFTLTRNSEYEAFRADFRSSAERLSGNFIDQLSLRFTMTHTLASAISASMEAQGVEQYNFSFAEGRMKDLSSGIIIVGGAAIATFCPRLETDLDRKEFETFAKEKKESEEIYKCHLCGGPTGRYSNPDEHGTIPGLGTFTCREIELAGLDGVIEAQFCDLVATTVSSTCFCEELGEIEEIETVQQIEFPDSIYEFDQNGTQIDSPPGSGPYYPIWEIGSAGGTSAPFLWNLHSEPLASKAMTKVIDGKVPVLSEIGYRNTSAYDAFSRTAYGESNVLLIGPVYNPEGTDIVGMVHSEYIWKDFFDSRDAFSGASMLVVIQNSCGQQLSFLPDFKDDSLTYLGVGDLHDREFTEMLTTSSYDDFETVVNFASRLPQNQSLIDYCRYQVLIYPTQLHKEEFVTNKPIYYAVGTMVIFFFSSVLFGVYDWLVGRRQNKVMDSAVKTNDIVTSLFPANVRERIYEQAKGKTGRMAKVRMESFAEGADDFGLVGEPIADLFPSADFTVWSAERDPSSMFVLLETIYAQFDQLAKRFGVFKVETSMDAYVAVCGLPKRNENHATVMATFASVCLSSFAKQVRRLEITLGPSTGDLQARVGLHSGPVTAGVLRGEKARFQLFGQTVNNAVKLEHSGLPMKIHASGATAELLEKAGNEDWLHKRSEHISAKGMGSMETFWVKPLSTSNGTSSDDGMGSVQSDVESVSSVMIGPPQSSEKGKRLRLIRWTTQVLVELLQNLVADRQRHSFENGIEPILAPLHKTGPGALEEGPISPSPTKAIVVDELVRSVLEMPSFDKARTERRRKANQILLPSNVVRQIHLFVTNISGLYRDVPFHNFEHCTHVIMSARKLMKRIIEPDNIDYQLENAEATIHDTTYGISSDPLLLFTVVFSALIHDADHTGLTNVELVTAKDPLAGLYRDRSVAEQNSVDLSWQMLNQDCFKELRGCIYTNGEELDRFRQLLVNAVIATDIADKQLKSVREERWEAAFASDQKRDNLSSVDANRRANVIYEYIIQASDIAHTMQAWNTYMKFNERLFEERYLAWIKGHAPKDPSGGWYGGELWFFDNYIIPTARKLNKCGVFGASYDELLTHALENRREWEEKGKDIVPLFLKRSQEKFGTERRQQT